MNLIPGRVSAGVAIRHPNQDRYDHRAEGGHTLNVSRQESGGGYRAGERHPRKD